MMGLKKNYVVIIHGLESSDKNYTLNEVLNMIKLVTRHNVKKMSVAGWTHDDVHMFGYKIKRRKQAGLQQLLNRYYPDVQFTYLSK